MSEAVCACTQVFGEKKIRTASFLRPARVPQISRTPKKKEKEKTRQKVRNDREIKSSFSFPRCETLRALEQHHYFSSPPVIWIETERGKKRRTSLKSNSELVASSRIKHTQNTKPSEGKSAI